MWKLTGFVLVAALAAAGCKSGPPPEPINSVRIEPFKCGDQVVAEAVRNVVIGMLAKHSAARIVREGPAEVVVEGTCTMLVGGSSSSRGAALAYGGNAGAGTRGSATGGDWISGVTALVLRNGEFVTSAEYGQELNSKEMQPPEHVAREFADELLKALRKAGLAR